MKKVYILFALAGCMHIASAQVYEQTFSADMASVSNGVVTDANYVGATPTDAQLTYLGAPTSGTVAVSGGALRLTQSSTSSRWGGVRNDASVTSPGYIIKFEANITVGSSGTSAAKFVLFAGNNLSNNTTMDANPSIHSGFGIKYQNSAYYYVTNLAGTGSTTQYAEGTSRAFTFVCNNGGAATTYVAPDGTTESIGDDKWDLWIDNAKVFDEQTATTNAVSALNSFKFGDINGNNGRADMVIDNFSVENLAFPLPLTFTAFNAVTKNRQVQLTWTSQNESNVASFTIERSIDSRAFNAIGTTTASNQSRSTYTFTDAAPLATGYYRVRATDKDGSVKYSNTIKVAASKQSASLVIAPNPVVGNLLNLQLSNLEKGSYALKLTDASGRIVYSSNIIADAGSSTKSIQVPVNITPGLYSIQLIGAGGSMTTQAVFKY